MPNAASDPSRLVLEESPQRRRSLCHHSSHAVIFKTLTVWIEQAIQRITVTKREMINAFQNKFKKILGRKGGLKYFQTFWFGLATLLNDKTKSKWYSQELSQCFLIEIMRVCYENAIPVIPLHTFLYRQKKITNLETIFCIVLQILKLYLIL